MLIRLLTARTLSMMMFVAFSLGSVFSSSAMILDEYQYENWTSRDGLPHNSINAITQTDDGYLWFATWEGIARFNGQEFKHFTRGSESGLVDSGVRALYSDTSGGLLAGGARGGLVYREAYHWSSLPTIKNLINAVIKQPDGGIWIGLSSEGLIFRAEANADNQLILPNLTVYQLSFRKNGDLLASTSRGLYIISGKAVENVSESSGLGNTTVYSAVEDDQGAIILGGKNGAWQYKDGHLSRIHEALNRSIVTKVMIDEQKELWFGTRSQGVFHYFNQQISSFSEQQGLSHNHVLSLYQDREKSIWIGTNGGLTRLRKAPFNTWDQSKGLSGNYVRTVLANGSGKIIAGTSNGLSVIEGDKVTKYSPNSSSQTAQKQLSVLSLASRSAGGAWVGTYSKGLYLFDQGILQPHFLPSLPTKQIRSVLETSEDELWVGTTAGLVKYSPDGSYKLFTTQDGLPDNYIMALSTDTLGRVWVGTGVGVAIIENNTVATLDLDPLDKAQYVFGFYAEENQMWMTTDRGLIRYRFSDKDLSLVGKRHGLPIDKLFQVLADSNDYFWLTSNRGIWRISQHDANAIADGTAETLTFEHYNELDGMASAQLNGGSNPAATIDSSGQLWFASALGVTVTHPQRFKQLVTPTFPTVIESVISDQHELDLSDEKASILPAGTQRVVFNFVGLGFQSSQHIRYKTKLEGLDSDWIERGSQGISEYTNLAPGEYRFVVNAYYSYHQSMLNEASYSFTILPHWWQRASIQLSIFAGFILMIALSFQWRVSLLQKSEMRLTYEIEQKTKALQVQATAFKKQAEEDQLTTLPNRRAFDDWIRNTIDPSGIESPSTQANNIKTNSIETNSIEKNFSIVMLDIDHFKRINDNFGHIIGDEVLRKIGQSLKPYIQEDCFIARWGGEEFVIGTIGWKPSEVYDFCQQLNQLIKHLDYSTVADKLSTTISIGIVNASTSHDFEDLLRIADDALFQVKHSGRDGIYVCEEPQEQITSHV
ncbi:ligand-binding sensor domain-containing protein [Vibrio cortegadensis]|uniref:diguanylate cyclase n=1 Tax=Vibrio cortegadensis TaxID=1328770 RepID=A0ABV4M2P7_9VIBR